ncbi:MAG: pyruvate dehydrogenase (acetyl-transferring) E1 component subunit alpha, partial [Candidatus Diapherotrites archaeon]|nr:pyruvate dehydrogenase (acetyl-transferring) E1 component subunit alpha [Candidatus Diapherotrites archaeon]
GTVDYFQVIDENGKADPKSDPKLPVDELKRLFEAMIQSRAFDDKCLKLQRSGKLGTYIAVMGQEAQVGAALALEKNDWLVPYFRDNGMILARGVRFDELLGLNGGSEWGSRFSELNILPIAIPVGTQMLHAAGIAWAAKLRNEKSVVLVSFGDGATSEGDFHEAMNFAGVYHLPMVFLCQNNQYAISVPRKSQSASETLAQKALAYGFKGVQVDGNDVLAVYNAVSDALAKARKGAGPTMIEMLTYRLADHSTADDSTKYRSLSEIKEWEKKDPIDRMRKYLKHKKIWSQGWEDKLATTVRGRIETAVQKYEASLKKPSTDMFDFLNAKQSTELERQREYYISLSQRSTEEKP